MRIPGHLRTRILLHRCRDHFFLNASVLDQPAHNLGGLGLVVEEHVIQLDYQFVSEGDQAFLHVVIEVELRL
jgi:hypothetical protein